MSGLVAGALLPAFHWLMIDAVAPAAASSSAALAELLRGAAVPWLVGIPFSVPVALIGFVVMFGGAGIAGLVVAVSLIALPPSLVLRRRGHRIRCWHSATVAGVAVGAVLGRIIATVTAASCESIARTLLLAVKAVDADAFRGQAVLALASDAGGTLARAVAGAAAGATVGYLQDRCRIPGGAGMRWIWASALGGALAGPVLLDALFAPAQAWLTRLPAALLVGALYGALTMLNVNSSSGVIE